MGKKGRLNKLISKWVKSDLPQDSSTVLLLGVTRIPTSPQPPRRHRPSSLPLAPPSPTPTTPNQQPTTNQPNRYSLLVTKIKKADPLVKNNNDFDELPLTASTPSTATCVSSSSNDNISSSLAPPIMERSVDSIGTCSLDVDVSATDVSPDLSDISSVGTLRSASILTPSSPAATNATVADVHHPHLPSYLSLACTINGYSTTTNYDPIRLSRSRDASPHRFDNAADPNLTPNKTYQVQNNLLSPPNLVPLPVSRKPKMAENTMTSLSQLNHLQGFYSSTTTTTKSIKYMHSSTKTYSSSTTDTVDTCSVLENGDKCVSLKQITNGTKYSNGTSTTEHKSFIQQRVERLYGPGALAQGFFVNKRQKGKLFDDSCLNKPKKNDEETGKHSKSMNDDLLEEDSASSMKQSTSSPSLPVLRHLRPEFRAQLPIIKSRKSDQNNSAVISDDKDTINNNHSNDLIGSSMQKSSTVPKLKNKENGHVQVEEKLKNDVNIKLELGGVKDGHYFLQILEEQTKRLLKLADDYERELETPNLSEEVIGKIRSATGKARLLVSQKMQQFRGLCSNNINQGADEAFPTTNEDLQGFWDMVMLQVDQVDKLFAEIETLKKNNWQEPVKEIKKTNVVAKKPSKTQLNRPTTAAAEEMRKKREQQRKQLIEERRKAMKNAQQQQKPNQDSIEIFVPTENS